MNTPDPIAWRVKSMYGIKLIVFAVTESKAKFNAWKVLGSEGWPSLSIERAPEYDKSYLRHRSTLAYDE